MTYTVHKWQERDRLHIYVMREGETEDPVAEWWDEDAFSMFEDGFFRPGKSLEKSVLDYCRDIGLI